MIASIVCGHYIGGMTDETQLPLIQMRRDFLKERAARLSAQLDEISKELSELATAERVLVRLTGSNLREAPTLQLGGITRQTGTPKPEGSPQITEMVLMAIKTAIERDGLQGLDAGALHNFVQKAWWPGAAYSSIVPTAARMVKDGRLAKLGSLYTLPSIREAFEVDLGELGDFSEYDQIDKADESLL